MNTILKYVLTVKDTQTVSMPKEATVLTVQLQNDKICIWAFVDTTNPAESRIFEIYGTGNPIKATSPPLRNYIGTVQLNGFVWHVFEQVHPA